MDPGNNCPLWEGSFTRLMDQYAPPHMEINLSTSHMPEFEAPIQGAHMSHDEVDEFVEIHVDAFGDDYEDDLSQSEEDDDEGVEAAEAAIRAQALNPNWNDVHEPDPVRVNSWQTWNSTNAIQVEEGFARGQLFESLEELKAQLTVYSTRTRKPYRTVKANTSWYVVVCDRFESCGCTWRLSAKRVDPAIGIWTIVRYAGPHAPSCVGEVMQLDHRNVTSEFIKGSIMGLIRKDQTIKPCAIMELINEKYDVFVSYMKAWKAKQKAIADIFGDWKESYNQLPRYIAALLTKNRGSVVEWCKIDVADPNVKIFKRVFWAFGPSIVGFEHCRPLITIDGTHLYGEYKHVLLMAMGVDAENHIFPLAFALVESENGDSWCWFMDCIGRRVTQRLGLCVISDRHKGIMKAMDELDRWREPNAHHRICIRHLKSNINSTYKDRKLKNLVGWTAYQQERRGLQKGINAIKELNDDAYDDLEKAGLEKWCLHLDGGYRYGVMTTNMSKCFNGVMKGARCLPITSIVQQSFYRVNGYFVKRRGEAAGRAAAGQVLSADAEKKIKENMSGMVGAQVITYDLHQGIFEVIMMPRMARGGTNSRSYTVNLREMTCSCESWKLIKVPCTHVLCVCRDRSISYVPFVDHYYSTEAFLSTYQMSFRPFGEPNDWPEVAGPKLVADPTRKREKGRPRSRRIANEMDEGEPGSIRCGLCKQAGHNRRSCAQRASTSTS